MNYTLVQEQRIGMRETNQDYLACDETSKALLLIVADGLGGYYGGQLAAEIAVGSVLYSFGDEARPAIAEPDRFLERALLRAHHAIHGYAEERRLPETPRTVLVACVVQDGHAWWNHIGDSRLYLIRNGCIEARTRDHSLVQELVDAGEIAEERAYSHPDSNRLLQSLGAPDLPVPGPGADADLRSNDILILCSDGFWGPLNTTQLTGGLERPSLRQSILELSDIAERRAGAHADNLAVLALRWQGESALRQAP